MDKIKRKYILLVMAIVLIIGITGTFAWYVFRSNNNAIVNTNVCAPEIFFVGGSTINGDNLVPTASKDGGLRKDINVHLNSNCGNDYVATLNLKLLLKTFPQALADSSFVWELYSGNTQISSGNFAGKHHGDIITLVSNRLVTPSSSTYSLYIYLNGNVDNPSTIGGQSFTFKIYSEGTGAVYNEYNMAQKGINDPTDSFWGSSINANQVRTITFTSINNKPASVDGEYDLSAGAVGDAVMWYIQNGTGTDSESNTINLYDVYVASREEGHDVMASTNASNLFAYLSNCISIDARGLNTRNTTNMTNMFKNDPLLTTIQMDFDTSNVTDMTAMFQENRSLTSLDLSGFDTSKVTKMNNMFEKCSGLTTLDLTSFSSPVLQEIGGMFLQCQNLTSIDFGVNFNIENVTVAQSAFHSLTSMTTLDLSNFKPVKVTNALYLFYNMPNVETIYVSDWWTTDSMTASTGMFSFDRKLPNYDSSVVDKTNAHYNTGGYLTYKAHA